MVCQNENAYGNLCTIYNWYTNQMKFLNCKEINLVTLWSNLVLENQLEECLQSLEREREEKISLRRELVDLTDRDCLPRTPSRNNQSIDPTNIPCPSSPESGSEVSILQAQTLKDRIRKCARFELSICEHFA